MRNLFIALVALVFSVGAQAQITTPAPSPACKMMQKVGMCDITLEYSRPSVKGRTIFGENGLVPFDKMWRTGANQNSMVTFSTDVMIDGQAVEAGTYSIFTIPSATEWTVYFYTDTQNWGTPESWDEEKVAATVKTAPINLDATVESMMFVVEDITMSSCNLELVWENTIVRVPVSMDTDAVVSKSISTTLAGPSARDYYLAARYYLDVNHDDMAKAADWAAKANEMDPKYWQLRVEALILGELERYPQAIKVAKESAKMAKEAGNDSYVRANNASIAEWNKMLSGTEGKAKSSGAKM
jgi:hypothetical protein